MLKKAALSATVLVLFSCGQSNTQSTASNIVHDPCVPLAVLPPANATAEQRQSISDAVAMWNQLGMTQLTLDDSKSQDRVGVTFSDAAGVFFGLYDPAVGDVIINQSLVDPKQRAVVIAHELGHAMGLLHIEQSERTSVMNRGNLTVAPTEVDESVLSTYWKACR